jgi:ferric-dicitrate binding protein FerR (iron transport regulator)
MNDKNPGEYDLHDFLLDDSFFNYYFERNEEDITRWKTMLALDESFAERAQKAGELLGLLSLKLPQNEFQQEYRKLENYVFQVSELKKSLDDGTDASFSRRPLRIRRIIALIAAASVILFVSVLLLIKPSGSVITTQVVKNEGLRKMFFALPDGTHIDLGINSELQYESDFNKTDRRVHLRGDAVFHVKKDPKRPFKVFEDRLTATVLGTVFNVIHDASDSTFSIQLLEGSLQVDMTGSNAAEFRTLYLKPYQQILYKPSTGSFIKERWNPDTLSTPVNHLVFKNADFEHVAKQIKEVYGITMVNRSNGKQWHFTAEFTNAEFKDVLQNICIVEGLKSDLRGDSVLLR